MSQGSNLYMEQQQKSIQIGNVNYKAALSYRDNVFSAIGSFANGIQITKIISAELEVIFTELKPKKLYITNSSNIIKYESPQITTTNPAVWIMVNGSLEIPTRLIWRPAITIGCGYLHYRVRYNYGGDSTDIYKNNKFAINIVVTHRFYINKSFMIGCSIRTFGAHNTRFIKINEENLKSTIFITSVELGFTYKFLN
ncbi:MAG: hypothetical protein HRT87_07275 [Legionellales bacterium]|nr:hypothetical protein [Legionellales bacterium]